MRILPSQYLLVLLLLLTLLSLSLCLPINATDHTDDLTYEEVINIVNEDILNPPTQIPKQPKIPRPPQVFITKSRTHDFLQEYAAWHKAMLAHKSCKNAKVVIWKPTAGFGDSVNALYTAIRQAFSLGRLFFIDWTVSIDTARGDAIDVPLWKIGLEPPFQWDLNEARTNSPWCNLPESSSLKAASCVSDRIVPIFGHLSMGHVLSASDNDDVVSIQIVDKQGKTKKAERVNPIDMAGFSEDWMFVHLLRPNVNLSSRIDPIVTSWKEARGVIGMHIRTGAADGNGKTIPNYAQFLAPGDESRFIRVAKRLIRDKYDEDSEDIIIIVATDNPQIVQTIADHAYPAHVVTVNAAASGLHHVVAKKAKEKNKEDDDSASATTKAETATVVHSGPGRTISVVPTTPATNNDYVPLPGAITALERMFLEWFLLRHTQHAILTAWSLFGSSATSTHRSTRFINSSACGKQGMKSCYPGAISQ